MAALGRTSRTADRVDFTDGVRLRLLEQDADKTDAAMDSFATELASIRKILLGILVSVTTASILLVVNVLTIGGR